MTLLDAAVPFSGTPGTLKVTLQATLIATPYSNPYAPAFERGVALSSSVRYAGLYA